MYIIIFLGSATVWLPPRFGLSARLLRQGQGQGRRGEAAEVKGTQ